MIKLVTLVSLMGLCASISFAECSDMHGMMNSKMTKEQREKMAAGHEKMALCLRTDKSIKDCHEEMKKNCTDTMGPGGCSMMDHKEMMGHHKNMKDSDKEKSDSK
jgi:hypothetical protein